MLQQFIAENLNKANVTVKSSTDLDNNMRYLIKNRYIFTNLDLERFAKNAEYKQQSMMNSAISRYTSLGAEDIVKALKSGKYTIIATENDDDVLFMWSKNTKTIHVLLYDSKSIKDIGTMETFICNNISILVDELRMDGKIKDVR